MNYRNPVFTADGGIRCEIEHPVMGWMPTTLRADDPETTNLYAAAEPDAAPYVPDLGEAKATRIDSIESARKDAEAEGVTVNGIRYAGDPSNRQALREAIEYADADSLAAFPSWKSSDDVFVADHPVQDVRDAYAAIGARRSQLIDREGQRVAEIQAATDVAAVEAVKW